MRKQEYFEENDFECESNIPWKFSKKNKKLYNLQLMNYNWPKENDLIGVWCEFSHFNNLCPSMYAVGRVLHIYDNNIEKKKKKDKPDLSWDFELLWISKYNPIDYWYVGSIIRNYQGKIVRAKFSDTYLKKQKLKRYLAL